MNVIKNTCDRVAVIDDARIVEVQKVIDIFSNPQTATSRNFINNVINREIPKDLLGSPCSESPGAVRRLIQVSFIGPSTGKPLISSLIKKFDVDANILFGNIDRIKDTPFGYLMLELSGTADQITGSLDYLHQQGLEVEVLENV